MIAVTVDAAAAHPASLETQSIGQQFALDAQRRQALRHGSEAIAFLDPQFRGAGHDGLAFSRGRRNEKHRELIDGQRYQRLGNADAAQSAGAHLDIGGRFGRLAAMRLHVDVGAHEPQHLQQPGAGRVHADVADRQALPGRQTAGHNEKRRR